MDITSFFSGLELFLCAFALIAAGVSYKIGFSQGTGIGAEYAVEFLVEDGYLSKYRNDAGEIEVCSAGVMNNICPKCGFHDGDDCEEHS